MFKKSTEKTVENLSVKLEDQIGLKKSKKLDDIKTWCNIFHQEIVCRIEEQPYSVLYSDEMGRSNAPIRQLIGMMILKDGHGWTDEQMFDSSNYNLQVMRALGFLNLTDEAPSSSTYYDFKVKVLEHYKATGIDLIQNTFGQITTAQRIEYKVSGKRIRMDSKLVSSNITSCTRLYLIISTVQAFFKGLSKEEVANLSPLDIKWLQELNKKSAANYVYQMTEFAKQSEMGDIGGLIYDLINKEGNKENPSYSLLVRLFNEQYKVVELKKKQTMLILTQVRLAHELIKK